MNAQDVAEIIVESINADKAYDSARTNASDALSLAASEVYTALASKAVTATAIAAALGKNGNKDTVARLDIVGQFLALNGEWFPNDAISPAHAFRTMVVKAVKAGTGLGDIRGAIHTDRESTVARVADFSNGPKVEKVKSARTRPAAAAEEGSKVLRLILEAAALVRQAQAMTEDVTEEESAEVTTALTSLSDLVNLFGRALTEEEVTV